MTEFETQMAARLQAHEFLIQALIRPTFANMTPSEAEEAIASLEKQFSWLSVSKHTDPKADLDWAFEIHRDAKYFLSALLNQCAPRNHETKEE